MKKSKFIVSLSKVFLLTAVLLIALAACSNPSGDEGKAAFTINLGDTGRMASQPSNTGGLFPTFSDLKYELTFSSAGKSPQIFKESLSAGKITGTIDAGEYNVSLKILLKADDSIYANDDGEHGSVTIKTNDNTTIKLHMLKDPNVEGDGSEGNPFKVYDAETLQKVGSGEDGWGLNKHYRQVANITLPSGLNWTPIGIDDDEPFKGVYDGGGKTISGLKTNDTTADYQGLFGFIQGSGAIVKNVGIVNCNIVGNSCVGGVVGNNQGTVQNCYATGTVSGNENVGGVVGNDGIVQNCYATSKVSGYGNVGGVVGNGGIVQKCYATGDVEGSYKAGGVAGQAGSVENCYATGDVKGDQAGGVVGVSQSGMVQNCYATGNVNGTSGHAGGVNGVDMMGKVQNCVALNPNISGDSMYVGCIEGYSESTQINNYWRKNMKVNGTAIGSSDGDINEITVAQWGVESWWRTTSNWNTTNGGVVWDFTNIWDWGGSLPILRNMPGSTQNPSVKNN
jgi:hypothetical protein